MGHEEEVTNWKRNPYFGEMLISRYNRYPFIARWKGISLTHWKEITDWVSVNFRNEFYAYENRHFDVCGVMVMDEVDLIHLKLKFHGN